MKKSARWLPILIPVTAALGGIVLNTGCTINSKITDTGGNTAVASPALGRVVPAANRVWVLTPRIVYEDAVTEAQLNASAYNGSALVAALTAGTISELNGKGINQVSGQNDDGISAEEKALAAETSAEADHLVRANPPPQAIQDLHGLASPNESVAVLAQYVRIKVGPHGTWDPNSGAITSGASSSYFRAALLDAKTGRRLWENSVQLREVAEPNSGKFKRVITLLFSTLDIQK